MSADVGGDIVKLVLDTNVVIAGLLWNGKPRQMLDFIIVNEHISIFSSPALLQELARTLAYPKFANRIENAGASIEDLLRSYMTLISIVTPTPIRRVVPADADDDHVIAAAVAAEASMIVTGDSDLLNLGSYEGIEIITVAQTGARLKLA